MPNKFWNIWALLATFLCCVSSFGVPSKAQEADTSPEAQVERYLVARIDGLRFLNRHLLGGAYKLNPAAAGIVWYQSNVGLHALALDGKHNTQVRDYLNRYLANATEPGGAIRDYENALGPIVTKFPDSDDAYAATMLTLASIYASQAEGRAWGAANLPQLKRIARANLLDIIDAKTGLTNTFNSAPRRAATLPDEKHIYQSLQQFMDNCEAARGIRDFADYLALIGDPEKEDYARAAQTVANGLKAQFDEKAGAFRWRADLPFSDPNQDLFYPGRLCQIFPQAFGLDLGPDTQRFYDAAWTYANARGDTWWKGFVYAEKNIKDDTVRIHDTVPLNFPHMMLGYVAALRGDETKARAQLNNFLRTLPTVRGTASAFGNIDETGWALKTTRLLIERKRRFEAAPKLGAVR